MKTKSIGIIIVFATMYIVIGYFLSAISFLEIQVRVADALFPLISFMGLPALAGLTIGHFALNLSSPLGVLDLFSVLLFVPSGIAIWKWGLKAVPLRVISVALWVAYMLNSLFGIPFWFSVITVGIGESIAEIAIGIPLAIYVKRRLHF